MRLCTRALDNDSNSRLGILLLFFFQRFKIFFQNYIVGLCTVRNAIKSCIVLAGDAKQLDAVTKSKHAMKLKFHKSFMEHLLDKKLYKRKSSTGKFNQNYMTQLVKNYRCHWNILLKPSELFYDSVLEAAAPEGEQ